MLVRCVDIRFCIRTIWLFGYPRVYCTYCIVLLWFILHRSRRRRRYSAQSRTRSRSQSRSRSYSRTRKTRYRGRHRSHSSFSDRKRDQGNRVSVVDLHTARVQCRLLWFGLGYAIDCTCQSTILYNYHRIWSQKEGRRCALCLVGPPSGTEGHVKRAVDNLADAGLGPIFEVGAYTSLSVSACDLDSFTMLLWLGGGCINVPSNIVTVGSVE